MKSRIWMAGVGLCLVLGGAWPATGAEYYVDDGSNTGDLWTPAAIGNDANNGQTPNTPKATLNNLIGTVALAAGDTVYIDTGTYSPVVISNTVAGVAGTNITFQGVLPSKLASGGTIIAGSGYLLDVRGKYLSFMDIQAVGGSWGVALSGAAHCEFTRVHCISNGQHGVRNSGAANSNLFSRCVVNSTQASAINLQSGAGNRFENCVIFNLNSSAIVGTPQCVTSVTDCILFGAYALDNVATIPRAGRRNVMYASQRLSFTDYETLGDLARANTNWPQNVMADPQFLDVAALDFHLLSAAGFVSNGVWATNSALGYSPAIDFGAPTAGVGAEPAPNGGRVNVGLFGGTAEASKSRTGSWTVAMSYNDGGTLLQTGRLEWVASTNLAGANVALEYSTNQWASTNAIATRPATNEFYDWVPAFSHPAVQWRVRDPASGFASTNAKPFSIRATTNATFQFYVNDGSTADDVYCQGAGNPANTGIASNSPVADLQELLKRYDLEGGDTVFVDTGDYLLTQTVAIAVFDSGRSGSPVRIVGSSKGTTFNRGNMSADVLDLTGASHLEFENLRLTGGRYGLNGGTDHVALRNVQAVANNTGFYVTGSRHSFERCLAADNSAIGFNSASTSSRSNQWNNGVIWGSATILQVGTNVALAVSNSILGNGTTLFGNQVATGGYNVVWSVGSIGAAPSFTALQDAGLGWSNSLYADPLFANATNYDFHLRSPAGRYDTNLADFVTTDANYSPAIDFGDPAASVSNEPTPNGGRLNAGLFGGTAQASKSRTNAWIQLASYVDGGTLDAQAGAWVRWNAAAYEPGATITIWLSRDDGASWEALETSAAAADGHYFYQEPVADDSSSRDALLRVELNGAVPPAYSQSPTNFEYRNGTFSYYVNDGSDAGDVYCSALGDDVNAGSGPGAPMRNLHALLAKLGQLGPGDRIYVDTGVYTATNVIRLTAAFSGTATNPVVIVGSTNRLAGGSLFRSVEAQARPLGFDFPTGASNLVLRNVSLDNVLRGVALTNTVNVLLDGVEVRGATNRAFDLQGGGTRTTELRRCVAHGGSVGLYVNQTTNVAVRHSIFWENTNNAVYLGSGAGLAMENSILASTATNAILYSIASTNGLAVDFNGIHAGPFARVGENRTTSAKADDLRAWQRLAGQDVHSVPGHPQLADPNAYDYHLKTSETLGRLLPNGQRTSDATSSPLLDAGNPATPIGEEPGLNGDRVNVGKYGGTAEASIAPATPWLQVHALGDAGSLTNGEALTLTWTFGGGLDTQTVAVAVSVDGGKTWPHAVASGVPVADGGVSWTVAGLPPTPAGTWRVVCEPNTNVWSRTTNFFAVRNGPLNLYVATVDTNEAVYVTAPGAADNWQAASNAPLNSLRTVFDRFDLEPGDQIWVDTGTYEEPAAVLVGLKDSGTSNNPVRVSGNANRPYVGTVLARTNRAFGVHALQLEYSDGLVFRDLAVSNAYVGIQANHAGVVTLERMRVGYCVTNAIVAGPNTRMEILHSIVEQSLHTGVQSHTGATVKIAGGLLRDNGAANVFLRGGSVEVKNSVLEASGSRRHVYFIDGQGTLDTDYNNVRAVDGANVGGRTNAAYRFLIDWQIATAFSNDVGSFGYAADFANPAALDFHLKSAYGRYDPVAGAFVTNDSTTSRLIDLGAPAGAYADYADEPEPNGGRVNVGLYGNTAQASKSSGAPNLVPLTMSDGGTVRGTVELHWTYNGIAGSNYVNVLFSGDGGNSWTNIASNVYVNAGSITWGTTNVTSTAQGVWRVELQSATNIFGQTETLFAVKNEPLAYYVNDGSQLGDVYCSAIGRSTNSGLTTNEPLNSLATLLGRYKVEHGDTVYVDTGVYSQSVPLVVSVPAAAPTNYLVIQGSPNEKFGGTVFTNSGDGAVFDLQATRNVELRDLRLHGGGTGLLLTEASSNRIVRVRTVGTRGNGYELGLRSDQNRFIQCAALHFFRTGFYVVRPTSDQIAPTTNSWVNGVISAVLAASNGAPVTTGALVGVRSGRLFASNSVFVANGPAHIVFDASADAFRGDYNAYHRPYSNLFARVAEPVLFGVAARSVGTLHEWQEQNSSDSHSFEADPLFADLANGDLHPLSAGGRYDPAISNFVEDAATSPLIDLADPAAAHDQETAPSGNRANLGVYGNDPRASRTPTNGTFVLLNFSHGGVARGTTPLRWVARGAAFTAGVYHVDVQISTNDFQTYTNVGANLLALAGSFDWDTTLQPSLPTWRWRVQCREVLDWTAASERDFAVHNSSMTFYVNDAYTNDGAYTVAPGAPENTGLTPDSPLPSLADVLARYDLEPGDEVRIDTGTYAGTAPVLLGYLDGGTAAEPVVVRGSPNWPGTTLTGAGIQIENARGIRLQDLRFQSAASAGIAVQAAEDVWAEGVDVIGGNNAGVTIQTSSNVTLRNFAVAYAASNGVFCAASFNTRLEFGTIWSNGSVQVSVRNLPSGGGSTNYDVSYATVRHCVLGAFGIRKPAFELRGNLFADYNNFYLRNGALAALSFVGGFGREYDSVGAWSSSEFGQDLRSLSHDPLFADARNGDFHPMSAAGRWVPATGSWTNDGVTSPLIDAGDPAADFAAEEPPNGGRVNIGRHGNTAAASRTPTNGALTLISFNDGGRASGTNVLIQWNARGAITNGTVAIWYSADGGLNWTLLTNGVSAADGMWVWDTTGSEQSVQASLRIEGSDGSSAQNAGFFAVRNSPFFFYVNDGSQLNDVYCNALGNNANSGIASNAPMADLNALLAKYDLEGGDVVYIDTGVYVGSVPWRITQADSAGSLAADPVVFQGSTHSLLNGTVLQRNFQNVGIQADYAVGFQLRNIAVSNTTGSAVLFNNCFGASAQWLAVGVGNVGFQLTAGSQLGVSNCVAFNVQTAVDVGNWDKATNTVFPVIQNNVFWEANETAVRLSGENQATVRNNVLSAAPGQYVYSVGANDTLMADYNAIWLGNGGRVFQREQSRDVSPVPIIYDTVGAWASASGNDLHSYDGDPLLVDATNRLFQLRSRGGRWTSGTNWVVDDVTSPLIDAGAPDSAAWTNEPADNGGRVNVGLFGGTPWASKSDTNSALHLLSLNRGGVASGQVSLSWTVSGAATGHTVRLEVSLDNGATWPVTVATGIPAALGGVVWNSSGLPSSPLALWRVVDENDPSVTATSELAFVLKNGPVYYYVNDEFPTDDAYCDAAGNSANTGASPGSPKRRVSEILDAYNLEPGDVVYVDTGLYQIEAPIVIGDLDAGGLALDPAQQVNFLGSTNESSGGTRFIVSDPGMAAFHLDQTYGIRLGRFNVSGATSGIAVADSFYVGGDWLNVRDCHNAITVQGLSSNVNLSHSVLSGNRNAGVFLSAPSRGSVDIGSSVLWSNRFGVYLASGYVRASNSVFGMVRPQSYGIYFLADAPQSGFGGDYNNMYVSQPNSAVGALQTGSGSSARTSVYATVSAWAAATGEETHSLAHDPLLADPGNGDFHLQSRGGRFVPGSGLAYDGQTSPLIDAGNPQSLAWTAEPNPNGRRLNIGLYGGTAEASRTPLSGWLTLVSLNDGGSAAGDVELKWTVGGAATNFSVCIEYSPDNGISWTNVVCGVPANSGSYLWDSVPFGRSALGLWRVYCLEDSAISATSLLPFVLRNGGTIPYYVNDASTNGDVYCTAPGNDDNHGYTPDQPKASLQAIIDAYELAPEDVVYVDSGTYAAGAPPITIDQTDSGWSNLFVTIQGSTNPAARTVFQAPSITVPCVFALDYAVNVRLKDLTVRGAIAGIQVNQTIGCEFDGLRAENNRSRGLDLTYGVGTRLVRSVLWNNGTATGGVAVALANSSIAIENSVLWGSLNSIAINSSSLTVSNSVLEASGANGRIYSFGADVNAAIGYRGDYNDYVRRNGALIAEQTLPVGGNDYYNNLPAWSAVNGSDRHSMTMDPEFADPINGDFHPKSSGGRYVPATGSWTNDAALSPLVDAGPPEWSVANEPPPNGDVVNLGAYGNTRQASMTQTNPWLRAVSYNDEGVMSGTVLLYWLHGGLPPDARVFLEYSTDYQLTWKPIATNLPAAAREYEWDVSSMPLSIGLNWRVVYAGNTNVWDASDWPVVVKSGTYEYYVNDGAILNDVWCNGPGLSIEAGANPTNKLKPINSLVALFANYPVGAGDVVYVDTGTYNASAPAVIGDRNMGTAEAPLRIFGSTNFAAGGALLAGNEVANGLLLQNTRNVEIYDLRISQARNGVVLQNVSGAKLQGLELFNNRTNGVVVDGSSGVLLQNARVWANREYGYYCMGKGGDRIVNCTFWGNGQGAIRTAQGMLVSNCILSVTNARPVYAEEAQTANVSGDNNLYGLAPGATLATNAFEKVVYANLSQWQSKNRDQRSLVADPLFVDPASGDFHLQSRGGYWNRTNWAVSPQTSWAIDAGPGTEAVTNESAPNGGRINLGAYGGTAQASRSDTNNPALFAATFRDGGTSADGQWLYWLYRGLSPTNTVRIEYSPDGGTTWLLAAPNADGLSIDSAPYAWYSSDAPSPVAYWRIVLGGNTNVWSATPTNFIFRPRFLTYYVNDASDVGDIYTFGLGSPLNVGYLSNSPLHSIQAVMERYPIAPGDEIRVDTGTYALTNSVFASVLFSGTSSNPVVFRGSTNWGAGGTTLTAAPGMGEAAFMLHGVRYLTLANFRTVGFSNGVGVAAYASQCTAMDMDIQGSTGPGVEIAQSFYVRLERVLIREGWTNAVAAGQSQPIAMDGCVLWSNRGSAISLGDGVTIEITNTVLEASGPGKYCYVSSTNPTIRADYNDLYVAATAQVASVNGIEYPSLPQWVKGVQQDRYSLSADPKFNDPANGDFHPRSAAGRYQPGVGWVQDAATGIYTNDFSPLIDMGKPQSAWSNEPSPHGNRRNVGLYGNTSVASKSSTNRWLQCVTAKSGGIVYGSVSLVWGYGGDIGSNDVVRLEYSSRDGQPPWTLIGDVAVGAGQFPWQSDRTLPGGIEVFKSSSRARWRISLRDEPDVNDDAGPFGLRNNPFKYYVNDGATDDDVYTTAPGDDWNYGDDVDIPKATLQNLLGNVDVEPGDQVYVDTGVYVMDDTNQPIVWSLGDGGVSGQRVQLRGSTHTNGSLFSAPYEFAPVGTDRAFFFMDASHVDARNLRFAGESLIFKGSGLVVSNVALTNRTGGGAIAFQARGDSSQFKDVFIDRASLTLSGQSNRVERMRQRWGETEIVGTNAVMLNSMVLTTNANRTGIVVKAAYSVVSNCTVLATRGTAVGKQGAYSLVLGHNVLVAGGTNDANAAISWADGDLRSDWNNLLARDSAWIGIYRGKWEKLAYWQTASGRDGNSVSFEPKFQNENTGDLHLNSQGGRWSPLRYAAGMDPWDYTDTETSPLVDLGNREISAGAEAFLPWGYRLNLGAYAGTDQASKSLTNFWLTALAHNDGGVVKGSNVVLRWTAGNAGDRTVAVQYSLDGTNWISIATGQPAASGYCEWNTTGVDGFNVRWRVVAEDGSGVADETDATFAVRNSPQNFYVGDDDIWDNVFCFEPGSAANDGLTSDTPKASLQQILDQYDLEGGDVVHVDTGIYATNTDVRVIWSRSGDANADVVVQGNPHTPFATVFARSGTTNYPAIGLDVKASHFQLRDLSISGVDRGILLESNLNATVQGLVLSEASTGIDVQGAQGTEILNSGFWKTGIGVALNNTRTSVLENLTFARSAIAGIKLRSTVLDVLLNNVFIPNENAYAYDIDEAVSLLMQAEMDYNLYDFSASNSTFFAGATNYYSGPTNDPLRSWQIGRSGTEGFPGMDRDYRSAIGPAGLADIGEYSWPPDLHPVSTNGRWVAGAQGGNWTTVDTNVSWAVDHGNPNSDFSLEPAENGGRINVGMYGNTPQASRGSTNVFYEIRSLDDEGIVLRGLDLTWPMVWSAHMVDSNEMVNVWFSNDGGINWFLLDTVPAYREYYLWTAGIHQQTADGLWRVEGTGTSGEAASEHPFTFIPIEFGIRRSPYNVGGLMRFDWQGGLPGIRYVIRYSDDFGQSWSNWPAKYNGPAPVNMSDFSISVTSTNYVFEDRTSYLKRQRWYRIEPYEEAYPEEP